MVGKKGVKKKSIKRREMIFSAQEARRQNRKLNEMLAEKKLYSSDIAYNSNSKYSAVLH